MNRNTLLNSILVSLLAMALLMLAVSPSSDAATVTIDPGTEHQTMEGWGAAAVHWENKFAGLPPAKRTEAFDLVFQDLGFNILCVRLHSNFQMTDGGAYDWADMADQRTILSGALKEGRNTIDTVWVKVGSPPGWMKEGDTTIAWASYDGHIIPTPYYYQAYADYLAYYFKGMQNTYGFNLDAVSLFNEPGYGDTGITYDSTDTNPAQYKEALAYVSATFAADPALQHVRFMAPEANKITSSGTVKGCYTSTTDTTEGFVPVLLYDPVSRAQIDIVSTHQYGDTMFQYDPANAPDNWTRLRDECATYGKPIWESEGFIGGANQMASEDIAEGLRAARYMWVAVTQGNVTAWHYHQYCTPWDNAGLNKAPSILSIDPDEQDFTVFPRYYVMKQWGRNVPKGSIRIDATSGNSDLRVTAWTKPDGDLAIIAFNETDNPISATFNCSSIDGPITHIRTSQGENYQQRPDITPTTGSFSTTIIGQSISTFVAPVGPSAPLQLVPLVIWPVVPILLAAGIVALRRCLEPVE
ncbi:glycoside hydrolase [Candidatus Hydrogenedentota bacterium]